MGDIWVTFMKYGNKKARKERREKASEIARAALVALKASIQEEQEKTSGTVRKDDRARGRALWREWYESTKFIREL